jgi:hypothetical protein
VAQLPSARFLVNPAAGLGGATAIFLRFPVGATNSGTCG